VLAASCQLAGSVIELQQLSCARGITAVGIDRRLPCGETVVLGLGGTELAVARVDMRWCGKGNCQHMAWRVVGNRLPRDMSAGQTMDVSLYGVLLFASG